MAVTGERSGGGEPLNGGVFSAAVSENGAFAPILDSRLRGGPRVYPCFSPETRKRSSPEGILDAEEAGGLFHDGR